MRINNISYLTLKYNGVTFGVKQPKDEKHFKKMRDEIEKNIEKFETRKNLAEWEFLVNSTEENKKKLQREDRRLSNYYNNNQRIFSQLSALEKRDNIKEPKLIRQLSFLLGLFDMSNKNDEKMIELDKMEVDISKKRNSFQIMVDGKPLSEAEILHRESYETDCRERKKLYAARVKVGDFIADDIIELIKKRNEFASKKGFKNFFEYEYSRCCDYSINTLNNWMQDVYRNVREKNIILNEEDKQEKAKIFGISPENIMEYHRKIILPNSKTQKISQKIVSVEQILDICKKAYRGMGFDIDKMPLIMDLFPRKNKDTCNFCISVVNGKDERISANLVGDFKDLLTLIHEMGHAVYDLNTDKTLNNMEKTPSAILNEGFAMMMEDVVYAENITKDISNIDLSKSLKKYRIMEIINDFQKIDFEKRLYENPYQNPKKLWQELNMKYNCGNTREELSNYWATINHFTDYPTYYTIYFLAELFKVQFYNTLTKKFGKITQNEDVRNYLKRHFFKYGSSLPDDEIVKKATGKSLSPEDFIKSVQ